MTDLQSTLDAIDELAVQQCGWCSKPLPADGESLDYCGPECQSAWLARNREIVELVGYREPTDLPAHVNNLRELHHPETTPARPDWLRCAPWPPLWDVGDLQMRFTFDASPLIAAFERLDETMRMVADRWSAVFDEVHTWQLTELRLPNVEWSRMLPWPEPEPHEVPAEPFGSDFDFEHTPASSLPHEPPPAVMPELPECDWQAVVDAALHRAEMTRWRIREQVRRDVLGRNPFTRLTGS